MPPATSDSESLSSVESTPPPQKFPLHSPQSPVSYTAARQTGQAAASTKVSGLDSGSELSELTEDEHDDGREHGRDRKPGGSSRQPMVRRTSSGRRKRGGMVPAPMWDWAYKSKKAAENDGQQDNDDEDEATESPTPLGEPSRPTKGQDGGAVDGMGTHDNTNHTITPDDPNHLVNGQLDHDGEISTTGDVESETDDEEPGAATPASPKTKRPPARQASAELSDPDEGASTAPFYSPTAKRPARGPSADEGESTSPPLPRLESESESDGESASEHDAESDDEEQPAIDAREDANLEPDIDEEQDQGQDRLDIDEGDPDPDPDADEVVEPPDVAPPVKPKPLAPAASSIMSGQQLIAPTPSRSTSPEPEQRLAAGEDADPDMPVEEAEGDVDVDLAEPADADVEAEAEEAELDMQPQHRAEALEVLAGLELKFALLRERLYVEKMEDLAFEESLVLDGIHPEMLYLQQELQNRHDRRLDLAAKKRRLEDESVLSRRKADENGVWSWWKSTRDELQTEMYAEANRKRRKLERERRLIERPFPARRIPPYPSARIHPTPISIRDIIKSTPYDTFSTRTKRKRRDAASASLTPAPLVRANPALNVLSYNEIQNDLQYLASSRARYYPPPMHDMAGPANFLGIPQDAYYDPSAFTPFGNNGPPLPPPPSQPLPHGMASHGFPPQGGRGNVYGHHQGPAGPPPPHAGQMHNPNSGGPPRSMQGPMHPHGAPPPPSAYNGVQNQQGMMRRSPSPGYGSIPLGVQTNGHGGSSGHVQNAGSWMSGASMGPGGVKQANTNGFGRDGRRVASGGKGDSHFFDGRERERELERERKREREREAEWHDKAAKDAQAEEILRAQLGPPPHLQPTQQPHRHTSQHQSLAGIPHHHHPIHPHHHHQPGHHHHHSSSHSQNLAPRRHELDRLAPTPDLDAMNRRPHGGPAPGPPGEPFNAMGKPPNPGPGSGSYWKEEEEVYARDRGRPPVMLHPNPSSNNHHGTSPAPPGPPDRDRPQVTPFVMTPSQATQVNFAGQRGSHHSRKESWGDDAHRRTASTVQSPLPAHESAPRHHSGHAPSHSHSGSPRRHPPSTPPLSTFPSSQMHSPPRLSHTSSGSSHPLAQVSPRPSSSTLVPRPITPLPAKTTPSSSSNYNGLFSALPPGPGTPSLQHSRIGTPNTNGPGGSSRGEPFPVNGHSSGQSMSLFPSPAGPAPPPHLPHVKSDSPRLPPPPSNKMSVVQLGNGS